MNLKREAITKYLSGLVLMGVLLFLPAGSFAYWQAWLLIGVLFIPMFFAGLVMLKRNPELLQKRLRDREEQNEQKAVIFLSGLMFLAAFIVAGLNFRFRWIVMPAWICIAAAVLFLLGYLLYSEVLRENGIVRHPMYLSTGLLFLSMPLVLGSVISFAIMLLYIPLIARRIRNEEQVLEAGLQGYAQYKKKVRYKVIPFVW